MSGLPEMGASFCIEWDSRRRNRRDLKKMEKMKRIEKIGSNSAFWPLLDAIGIYSWSFGCLPIIFDVGDFGCFGVDLGSDFCDSNDLK